jgi:hypothetical protein
MPESNLPSACAFSPDVAVYGCESSFVHVTITANIQEHGLIKMKITVTKKQERVENKE